MKVIILAAGYATRLYPLTLNQPKPLLPVGGRPMLEHVLEKLEGAPGLHDIFVVTNQKFSGHFEEWAKAFGEKNPGYRFKVINDGSTNDADKLGAIGDMHFVVQREKIDDDLLVIAGDNLFNKSLADFVSFGQKKKASVLALYDVGDLESIKKYNSVTTDSEGRITFFEEKPKQPTSTRTGIALYYYPKDVTKLIATYIAEGNNPDQPGRFVQWLYPRVPVYTWDVPGIWYDIGSKETLEEADRIFSDPVHK